MNEHLNRAVKMIMNCYDDMESNQSSVDGEYERIAGNSKVVLAMSDCMPVSVASRRVKSSKPTRRGFYDQ